MHGQNPIRPPEKGDGSILQVVEVFPTLQGEGPFTGHPAVFVRLGGCNLACGFCDTEFETFEPMALESLLSYIDTLSRNLPLEGGGGRDVSAEALAKAEATGGGAAMQPNPSVSIPTLTLPPPGRGNKVRDLVVITGGEPLRQNIAPLCAALLAQGYRVQIETNGTLWRDLPEEVNIVCSPKAPYHALRTDLLARTDALKFIISADDAEYSDVADVGQGQFNIPVYVQPMDVYDPIKNAANVKHAAALAQQHGYRLSLQTHKILGIA